jgi:STE24 endopeptidase
VNPPDALVLTNLHSARQYKYYSKKEAPPNLKAHVPHEKFEKSQAYGKDKANFQFFKTFYSQIWDSLFLYYGGFALCWQWGGYLIGMVGYGRDYQVGIFRPSTVLGQLT